MSDTDLNLLTALDVLLTEGSVAGAARVLGLSASAMSRTLSRLREATSDLLSHMWDPHADADSAHCWLRGLVQWVCRSRSVSPGAERVAFH